MLTAEEKENERNALLDRRQKRKAARRKRVLFYVLCAVIGAILLVGTAYWSYQNHATPAGAEAGGDPNRVNVLVLGVDSGLVGGARTDTMIVVSLDKKEGTVDAVAIPRDTRVRIPGRTGYDRVNAAHAYGGPKLAVRTVENLLGIRVDYYLKVDYKGFERIVDTLGGVVVDVEKPMHYVDNAQGLYIDLKQGVQLLDGKKALDYVRYRDGLGDVALVDPETHAYGGRIDRQLKFAKTVANQALSARNVFNAPKLINQLRDAVDTDMPPTVALEVLLAIQGINSQDIQAAILPGSGQTIDGVAYWIVNEPLTRELVNRRILHRPLLRVEVLNGSGRAGLASQVADILRSKGFEVVTVGNADRFDYAQTVIIPRDGDQNIASQVAAALGGDFPENAASTARLSQNQNADVTVILGRNFRI